MRIVYLPGTLDDPDWRAGLTHWQERELAALHRQGRHLPDRTDHGSDKRWAQAGVKTRYQGQWKRNPRHHGHERVLIRRADYGFDVLFVRRERAWTLDPDTGEMDLAPEAWVLHSVWRCGRQMSANHDHPELGKYNREASK